MRFLSEGNSVRVKKRVISHYWIITTSLEDIGRPIPMSSYIMNLHLLVPHAHNAESPTEPPKLNYVLLVAIKEKSRLSRTIVISNTHTQHFLSRFPPHCHSPTFPASKSQISRLIKKDTGLQASTSLCIIFAARLMCFLSLTCYPNEKLTINLFAPYSGFSHFFL